MICSNFPPGMEIVNLDSEFTAVDTTREHLATTAIRWRVDLTDNYIHKWP